MSRNTDDVRIGAIKEVVTSAELIRAVPCSDQMSATVLQARRAIHDILRREDDRLLVVIGPCSIHDPTAAKEYAQRLLRERQKHAAELEVVMRVYFEKPRTTVGWKGLINDPDLDGSFRINHGLLIARELLAAINQLGLPAGCEYLDLISPQYISDLVSWGAIGARTTESQTHRELASGLSCPVGFKNGTDGSIRIAVDALKAASQPHHFLGVTKQGRSAVVSTHGNEDCHVILRGGVTPNYDSENVALACKQLREAGLAEQLMIDASHANSSKKYERQVLVCEDIASQLKAGEHRIIGVMVESHLLAGKQELKPDKDLTYGQSITDGCIGWEESVRVLDTLASAVKKRRASSKAKTAVS